jgi:uncharacterized protein
MLIRFKVSNFLSFKGETEFSMVAGKERIHPNHVIKGKSNQPNLLRAALLYGANAAGKSNFVKAIGFVKQRLNKPLENSMQIAEELAESRAFKGLNTSLIEPNEFSFEFVLGREIFQYELKILWGIPISEKLSNSSEGLLFHRETETPLSPKLNYSISNIELETTFKETEFIKKSKDREFIHFAQKSTKAGKLFLRHCKDNNVEVFSRAYDWFNETLQTVFPETIDNHINERVRADNRFQAYLISLLLSSGTGISSIEVLTKFERVEKLRKHGVSKTFESTIDEVVKQMSENNDSKAVLEAFNMYIFHGSQEFKKSEESSGTQRLMDLAFPFYDLMTSETPKVYIIDELENSLHTNLSYSILKNYLEQGGNNQLIATTHDTHLLDLELLRKDEIWFAEKNNEGATELYSLIEFNPRYDKKIEKEYLTGRFGAIPFLGNMEFKRKLSETGKK